MAQRESSKSRETVRRRSDSYIEIYTNSVDLKVSVFDFEFILGKVLEASETKLEIEEKASMSMSPQHAKELLRILSDNIRNYESKFGPIVSNIPSDAGAEKSLRRPKRLIDLS